MRLRPPWLLLSSGAWGCSAQGPDHWPCAPLTSDRSLSLPGRRHCAACASHPGLEPPGHGEGPVRDAWRRRKRLGRREAEEQDAGGGGCRRHRHRHPRAPDDPDSRPRMEPALGAAAAPSAPATRYGRAPRAPGKAGADCTAAAGRGAGAAGDAPSSGPVSLGGARRRWRGPQSAGCWEGLAGLVAPERGDRPSPSLPPSGEGSKLGISVGRRPELPFCCGMHSGVCSGFTISQLDSGLPRLPETLRFRCLL